MTLTELRRRYSIAHRRVLRRGQIKTKTEYYLINGLVVDLASNLSAEEREKLQAMVVAYEGYLSFNTEH